MKYLLILFTFINFSAFAGDFKLTHGGTYNMNLPTHAKSYDGKARDVSKFYESNTTTLYVGGQYLTDDKSTAITTTYDNGYDSQKFNMQKSIRIDVQHHKEIMKNGIITFSSGYKFGGDTKHSPCVDSYDREYYCGNLTAWSDFDQKESEDGENYNIGIRFTFSF